MNSSNSHDLDLGQSHEAVQLVCRMLDLVSIECRQSVPKIRDILIASSIIRSTPYSCQAQTQQTPLQGVWPSVEDPWGCSARDPSHTSTTQKTFRRRIARLSSPAFMIIAETDPFFHHRSSSIMCAWSRVRPNASVRTEIHSPFKYNATGVHPDDGVWRPSP